MDVAEGTAFDVLITDLSMQGMDGMRLMHSLFGELAPAEFLPPVTAQGHLHALACAMLRTAVAGQARWRRLGCAATASVNVPASLTECEGAADRLLATVRTAGGYVAGVTPEFAETGCIRDTAALQYTLARARINGSRRRSWNGANVRPRLERRSSVGKGRGSAPPAARTRCQLYGAGAPHRARSVGSRIGFTQIR
ncbi:hypothetical protein CF70_003345 [Cupriavidus sp. SK-3]|uniref:EAL domain-containing protein n=1 Tax=Cupriavidus sp. SK-3 TaxID=1470558 RepID=UPI00044FBBC9|nr:EAL domain-containing protein [Cupriavidus sp. SK-3]KDP87109.1 hypothetical protein CF70_003345 [Cupriavidus sp. SK-3]